MRVRVICAIALFGMYAKSKASRRWYGKLGAIILDTSLLALSSLVLQYGARGCLSF